MHMAPSPHTSFETKTIFSIIDYIAKEFKSGNYDIQLLKKMAIIANSFWFEYFSLKKKMMSIDKLQKKDIDKNVDSGSPIFFLLDDKCLLTEQNDSFFEKHVQIPKSHSNYNYYRINLKKNTRNTLKIFSSKIKCSSKKISIVVYDFRNKKNIFRKDFNVESDIFLNFIVTDDNIAVLLYAGLQGETQGHSLEILEYVFTYQYL